MQRLSFALLFALCFAVVSGQARVTKAGFYSYTPPKGAQREENSVMGEHAFQKFYNDSEELLAISIDTRETDSKTTEALRDRYINNWKKHKPGKAKITIRSVGTVNVDGKQVPTILISSKNRGEEGYSRFLMVIHKGKEVLIVGTYVGAYKKMDKEFLASLSSFKWQ